MGMPVESLRLKLDAKKLGIDVAGLEDSAIKKAIEAKKGLVQIVEATPAAAKAAEFTTGDSQINAPKFVPPTGRTFTAPPVSAGHNGVVPVSTVTTAAIAEDLAAQAIAPEAPKKPRGRAAKAAVEVSPMSPVACVLTKPDGSKLSDDDLRTLSASVATPTFEGFLLLVNVVGLKIEREVILLSTFLVPVHAAIKEAHGLPHYSAADFGKGRGILAEALEQYLTANAPLAYQAIFVDARTAEGADALPTLERHAGEIYRGV